MNFGNTATLRDGTACSPSHQKLLEGRTPFVNSVAEVNTEQKPATLFLLKVKLPGCSASVNIATQPPSTAFPFFF